MSFSCATATSSSSRWHLSQAWRMRLLVCRSPWHLTWDGNACMCPWHIKLVGAHVKIASLTKQASPLNFQRGCTQQCQSSVQRIDSIISHLRNPPDPASSPMASGAMGEERAFLRRPTTCFTSSVHLVSTSGSIGGRSPYSLRRQTQFTCFVNMKQPFHHRGTDSTADQTRRRRRQ